MSAEQSFVFEYQSGDRPGQVVGNSTNNNQADCQSQNCRYDDRTSNPPRKPFLPLTKVFNLAIRCQHDRAIEEAESKDHEKRRK